MKKALQVAAIAAGLLILAYAGFWLYVRFGGEPVRPVDPRAWILPDPGTDLRRDYPLSGPGNFRTLGAIRIDSNSIIRPDVLFRSDAPSKYTREDWENLERLGVRLVIDLRSDQEREEDGYQVTNCMEVIHQPVYRDDPIGGAFSMLLFERHKLHGIMEEAYQELVIGRAEAFGEAFKEVVEHIDRGVVFHCTAGKDRTGILAALLLGALGADRETILYDYALSNKGFESNFNAFIEKDAGKITRFGIPPKEMEVLLAVDPVWLEKALDLIDERYGGIESYLVNEAGVPLEDIDMLRQHLIVSGRE